MKWDEDIDDENDHSLSIFFEQSGFESMSIIKNLSSTLVYLIFITFGYLSIILLKLLGMYSRM